MSTLSTPLAKAQHPTPGDDARTPTLPFGALAGQSWSGGGNGIGGSVSSTYLFDPATEIGGTSVEGQSIRNLAGGGKWGGGAPGTGASVTYSFLVQGVSVYAEAEGQSSQTWSFSPAQRATAQLAQQSFANVANITFTEVTDTAVSAGDIRWGNSVNPSTAWAYFPSPSGVGGNIWMGANASYANPAIGSYGFHTFIHELGHAMGLEHPHDSENPPVAGHDRLQYSIMSYRGYLGQPLNTGYNMEYFPTAPMIDDIAALQALYGANMSYNATNTVYVWAPGAMIFETLWDAGGNDRIDVSNQTQGAIINLQPGTLSSIGAPIWNGSSDMRDTLGIAYGATIENATGTALADAISGNAVANDLAGGGGNDTLRGLEGNDTLAGGAGNDSMEGGAGNDTYAVDSATDVVVEALNGGTDVVNVSLAGGTYTLGSNVENAVLLPGAATGITGNALANHLTGNALSNTLVGGTGVDTLVGGAGDDTYQVDVAGDEIQEAFGEGTDFVQVGLASGTYLLGGNIENATVTSTAAAGISGNDLANLLTGNAAANTLTGDGGDDTLDGAAGGDRLVGGQGNDSYRVDMASDVIVESTSEGTDTVEVSFAAAGTYVLTANVENATITNTLNVNLTGGTDANVLTGGAGANLLSGAAGDDTLVGGLGKDTLDGGAGTDTAVLQGNRNEYTVTRTATEVALTRAGQIIALRGVEQLVFDDGPVPMSDLLDNAISAFGDTVEGTAGNDTIDGLAGNDSISGLQGHDSLIGGAGVDTLVGGAGDDVYHVDVAADLIVEALGEGADFVQVGLASGTYLLGGHIENATVTSAAAVGITGNGLANLLIGNAAANTLTGGADNDTLDGAAGGDRLVGGQGDDQYVVNMASDVIVEAASEGADTVAVSFTAAGAYVLSANVENATITNAFNVNLTGNVGANVLTGGAGANLLNGGGGEDILIGGLGNDTLDGGTGIADRAVFSGDYEDYVVARVSATDTRLTHAGTGQIVVVRNVDIFEFNGGATMTMAEVVANSASIGNDALSGTTQADLLDGLGGNDTLSGLDGNDTLKGGVGDDLLVGGLGDDSLDGGAGNDTYEVDAASDQVVEALNAGIDLVRVALSSGGFSLGANVENALITSSAAVGITGNALVNLLTGNGEANALSGAEGNDTLNGADGNDTLDGGAGADRLVGGLGDDRYLVNLTTDVIVEALGQGTDSAEVTLAAAGTLVLSANVENATITNALNVNLTGNAEANVLTGGAGANLLNGAAGNDTLIGGLGRDTLTGGTGQDRFEFSTAPATGNVDTITDFVSGTDVIALDADVFTGLGAAGATIGLSANLTYTSTTGILAYDADGAGGAAAVQIALLGASAHPATLGADFLLI